MTPVPSSIFLERPVLARAAQRLPMLDFQVLFRLVLLADPHTLSLSASWDALTEEVGLLPSLLPPILERLRGGGYVTGRIDAPDGVHLHFDALLSRAEGPPPNLPFEPAV